jgi:hypothetical protein
MSTARQVCRCRKPDRRIELTRPPKPDAAGKVVIILDGQAQEYTLTPQPCQFGAAAFRVGKVALDDRFGSLPPVKQPAACRVEAGREDAPSTTADG